MTESRRRKIFTWHIHGSYLFYLSQGNYDIYIPVNGKKNEGYYGRGLTFPFGANVIEVDISELHRHHFDLILYQTDKNYLVDQFDVLSDEQRKLPRVFLKHDAPPGFDKKLVVEDPEVLVIHVTDFNRIMWDNNGLETRVIMHGVTDHGYLWNGMINKGIVVINNLTPRGRMLGADLFSIYRESLPIDIVGMGTEDLGGKEVLHPYLPAFIANYRFFLNPIRYSSFPLSLCEAMMAGLPVVALATTELPMIIKDGINGFLHNDPAYLADKMRLLLNDYDTAKELSLNSRKTALKEFGIERFINDWTNVFDEVSSKKPADLKSY
ncbi:MAG TPA: glycosyltransferase family 4 protein [Lentimicrobium sp.]|nr:glycosyltransferase family 4 protein [Lentimicrobium sp.]